MPGRFSGRSVKAVFTAISLLALFLFPASAREDFDSGLSEGKTYGREILRLRSDVLEPSEVPRGTVPGLGGQSEEDMKRKGTAWKKNPDLMRTEAENETLSGNVETSGAAVFLRRSSVSRPVFAIDPETDPVIRGSRRAIEDPVGECQKIEACAEYSTESWNERESCYDQISTRTVSCEVRKRASVTERTETFGYMTLEIDRNDSGVGFSAVVDTDGDGAAELRLRTPGCVNRKKGNTWGNFGGVTLGGPLWRGCFVLDEAGKFISRPAETCVAVFGLAADSGGLPLGDGGDDNDRLQSIIASAIMEKFPPPPGARVVAALESSWGRARRCRTGDGNGNGRRVSYTATLTVRETEIVTDDRCRNNSALRGCGLTESGCARTTETPDGGSFCAVRKKTYRCEGTRTEDPDCAALRAEGCHQTGTECVLWSGEHSEFPDPPETDLGTCLVRENVYSCPKSLKICGKKIQALECGGLIRCASGADCFDTTTEHGSDFPKSAARMEVLADMERCLATPDDGVASPDGYEPVELDGSTGETAPPVDCSDNSAGEVSVFKGKNYSCDLNLAGFVQNCCRRKGLFAGNCPASTKELRARRDDAKACRYVGIRKKKVLGITVKKRKVYCCFNSKMARLVHEQGRPQLIEKGSWAETGGGGWGSPKNPECGGMTAEQLREIDFDSVEFSEIYGDIFDEAGSPELPILLRETSEDAEELCLANRGEDESVRCDGGRR